MSDHRLYLLGDVHWPSSGTVFPSFLDQLANRPPARLVILGDLFDWWVDTAECVTARRPILDRLRRLVDAGWHLDLVIGNRELAAGRCLAKAIGGQLHWPNLDLHLGTRRLRLMHGDRLGGELGYHLYAAFLRGFWFRPLLWFGLHAVQSLIATSLRAGSQQRAQRHPYQGLQRLSPRRLAAAWRGVDVVVAGHIHLAWSLRWAGRELHLAGDWSNGTARWLEGLPDGTLVRHQGQVITGQPCGP